MKYTSVESKSILERLLEINKELYVSKDINGKIIVHFSYAYISDNGVLIGNCGRGQTFGEAVADYYNQICGKILVFDNPNGKRETYFILG